MPPWQVEAEAPDEWMERALLWANAKAERQQKPRQAVGETKQVGNVLKKRLV